MKCIAMIRGPRSRLPSDNIQALGMTTMIPQPQYTQTMPVRASTSRFDFTGHALAHRVKKHGGAVAGSGLSAGGAMKDFSFGTPSTTHEHTTRPYRSGYRHGGVTSTPHPISRHIAGQGLYA